MLKLGIWLVRFEWDEKKAAAKLRKHKVSFPEAVSVFYDPLSATGNDPEHSIFGLRGIFLKLVDSHRE